MPIIEGANESRKSLIKYPRVKSIVGSTYLDVIGALLIFSICYFSNFHGTIYHEGELRFGVPFADLWSFVRMGAYPLGIFSTVGAVFSMLATRFVSKQNNTGNFIGIITTVNSGLNDFLFGNRSAIITYPLTFITHSVAFKRWADGEKIRPRDKYYYAIISIAALIATSLVFLGAYLFGGKTNMSFLIVVAISFSISLGATISNAFKYQETWVNWIIYNLIQIIKNAMIFNIANLVKYAFYIVNASLTLVDWKYNGDR